jgi:hypothetical protein
MIHQPLHISYFPESITFNAILLEETICKIWNTTHEFPLDTALCMYYWHSTKNSPACHGHGHINI